MIVMSNVHFHDDGKGWGGGGGREKERKKEVLKKKKATGLITALKWKQNS